jgi:hypothetical protein
LCGHIKKFLKLKKKKKKKKKKRRRRRRRRRKSDLATPTWPDLKKNYGATWED